MKKTLLILVLFSATGIAVAQNKGVEAVWRFGNNLAQWCNKKSIDYRDKVVSECAGKGGKECRVHDNLMIKFANLQNLPQIDTYTLESYLTGFQSLMRRGDVRVQISDVRLERNVTFENPSFNDERFFFVSCNINVTGVENFSTRDLFYIRKIGANKISKIGPYKDETDERTGRTKVIVNTSDIMDWDGIANGDYNSIEVSYSYSSHYPLNIGVTTNFSYFNIGVEYGQNFSNEPLDFSKHTNFATSEIAGKYFYLMGTPGIFLRRASVDCGLGAVFTSYKYQSVYTSDSKKNVTFMMKPKVTFHIPVPLNFSSNNEKMYISPHIAYQYVPKYGKLNCWEVGIGIRIRFETY